MEDERRQIIASIEGAVGSGARLSAACEMMGISPRTYQRWNRPDNVCDGRIDAHNEPPNKLSEEEREKLVEIANSPQYADVPPFRTSCLLSSLNFIYRASFFF